MKIAVIGANGYIGKHLVYYLEMKGCEVAKYDLFGEDCIKCNLSDRADVDKIDLNVDFVYMFAGKTGTYDGFDDYSTYLASNDVALLNLLDSIRKSEYRPKVIFPSSRLVYKGVERALKEDDEKESKTIYAVNKIACEGYLAAYANSFNIPYTIFRICVPFGNMFSTDYSFGTVGFMIKQAKVGEITLYGDGTMRRTLTSMEDLCFQIYEAAKRPESNNQIYNIGGNTYMLKEVAEIVAAEYGASIKYIPYPERDLKIESGSTFFDYDKISKLTGYQSKSNVKELFVHTL